MGMSILLGMEDAASEDELYVSLDSILFISGMNVTIRNSQVLGPR